MRSGVKRNKPSKQKANRAGQSGQLIIEAILIMVLVLGITILLQNQFRDRRIIGSLVAGPWGAVAGMISNGAWKSEAEGRVLHPQGNIISREGDSE